MNQRITELAKQCASEDHLAIYNSNYAKFAELIVRECMDLVKDCYAEPESGQSPYQTVCASTIIEEQFVVEEFKHYNGNERRK